MSHRCAAYGPPVPWNDAILSETVYHSALFHVQRLAVWQHDQYMIGCGDTVIHHHHTVYAYVDVCATVSQYLGLGDLSL